MPTDIQELRELVKDLLLAQKETDAKFKETDVRFKETDVKFKQTDKKIKEAFDLFTGQWGKLMESLVEGDLINLLNQRGVKVHDTSMRRKGSHKGQNFEFDIIAHNGNEIVIVEVKTTLKVNDVKKFVSKLSHAREWLDEYRDYNVIGAVAYLRADEGSDLFAASENLFVIRATGNSATIINEEGFKPRYF